MNAPAASPYERLGGIYSIATVVDDFIDRIMVDERLNANPRVDEAHHKADDPVAVVMRSSLEALASRLF